ncbi:M23 family metallopeptidase [Aurantiacibacter aquimixticola]|uniref:M23 family metallopeptidase n=1 Tax=Aurantiacibacter aquimixticola TaxID=1958945 RepID=A0A419RWZ0_9SPHN|nr:M23 family metallopeptidase [Aurantiacibacter aquimixticola]RJY10316.1 M23 family metallopeptidase [Aurantiacibacter aquimixticola]
MPAPLPTPTPAPTPAGPTTFLYDGELTQGGWMRGTAPAGTVSARLGEQELDLGADNRFFAAFDRDSGRETELVATLADGRSIRSPVAVSPREWDIERVNVARRPGGASAAFMRRRQPELDAIWDARTAEADSDGWREDFIWPVTGRISGRFGSQRIYRGEPGSYHSGLDIARPTGTPFVAPASGVVTLATDTPFSLEGYLLIIDHGQGLNSAFLHMDRIDVREGERVEQGQQLGTIGSSGRATGPHLHWSLKWHLTRLDPLLFVGPMPE